MKKNGNSNVKILDFKEQYVSDFVAINHAWLHSDYFMNHFKIEPYDLEVLNNPMGHIIDKGGYMFFAKFDAKIVGTVALIPRDTDELELSKLAVLQDYRGKNISDELMGYAINFSKNKGVKLIWLDSIKSLKPAISLFTKFGFKEVPLNSNTPYSRADIKMELVL